MRILIHGILIVTIISVLAGCYIILFGPLVNEKPIAVPGNEKAGLEADKKEAVREPKTLKESIDAGTASAPADANPQTKSEPAGDPPRIPQGDGTKQTSSNASPSTDGGRERVEPILRAIDLHADNKPLLASLISDIRRAGSDAIQASMPELLTMLETDNDPRVQLVLVSTLARAPNAVPVRALPLIKRIVQSETAQRELRDQGNFLIERLQARE